MYGFISLLKYSTLRPNDVPCTWLKLALSGLAGVMSIWDNGLFIDVKEDDADLDFIQGSESWEILDKAVFSRSENQNKLSRFYDFPHIWKNFAKFRWKKNYWMEGISSKWFFLLFQLSIFSLCWLQICRVHTRSKKLRTS